MEVAAPVQTDLDLAAHQRRDCVAPDLPTAHRVADSKARTVPSAAHAGNQSLERAIRARQGTGGKAFVPYLVAGFPSDARFVDALRRAEDAGCDAVEVGIPFSDPIADGPVIQSAGQYCLERGVGVCRALELIHGASPRIPVVLMSYLNPLLAHGCGRLSQDALAAGVRGLVIPDLPLEPARSADREPSNGTQHRATQVYQAGAASARRRRSGQAARETAAPHGGEHDAAPAPLPEVIDCLWRGGLQRILLAAPTTPDARLTRIGRRAQGFLYAVTVTGVTGVRDCISSETVRFLARASAVAGCPVLAGFGIADARSAARAARHCDGVIIGSALVEILRRGSARRSNDELRRFLVQVRRALRHVKGARQC